MAHRDLPTERRAENAVPGCTELEAQWLISHPAPVDSPALPAPQSQKSPAQNKRKASNIGGSELRNTKRSAAASSAPVRRSPRSHHTPITEPTVVQDTEAPSDLAASYQNLRPQLSQAFGRLYGTAQHRGILASLAILKLYCDHCLDTTWTGNPARDPAVFFRTADMADTNEWQRLPEEFEKNQAEAYSFTQPDHSANLASDRSSGQGPVNGRPR
jgi:hypothetical protein